MLQKLFLITACVFSAFYPALGNGYIWDDDEYVTTNATLRSVDGLRRIWLEPDANWQYYPLVFTTFWVEYHLWGLEPFGFHLTNICLHAAAAALLYLVLARLAVPGAFLCALLFAVHPVHTESVAWITERKNVLSAVFYLLALLTAIPLLLPTQECQVSTSVKSRWRSTGRYTLVLLLFVAAMLSKTVVCSLPAAMLLAVYWKSGCINRRQILVTLPLFATGLAGALVTVTLEHNQVGAAGSEFAWTFAERCLIAGRALWMYATKLIYPTNLMFFYPKWSLDTTSPAAWSYPAAAVAVVLVALLVRKRCGRGPLVCLLFFGGTLLPALGFINVYPMRFAFVADHFQYLASIGILMLAAGVLTEKTPAFCSRRIRWTMSCVWVGVLIVLTRQQCGIYRDAETLWRDTIASNPRSAAAHNNLAEILLLNYNNRAGALYHYRRSLEAEPQNNSVAEISIWWLEGEEHLYGGRPAAALDILRKLVHQYPEAPLVDRIYADMASACVQLDRHEEAVRYYRRAIDLRPTAGRWTGLANALRNLNRTEEALAAYRQALRLNPLDEAAQRGVKKMLEPAAFH